MGGWVGGVVRVSGGGESIQVNIYIRKTERRSVGWVVVADKNSFS